MTRKIADSLINTNQEYEKLKNMDTEKPPREQPQRQTEGMRGFHLPRLERWTSEELRDYARKLEIDRVEAMERKPLLDKINESLAR